MKTRELNSYLLDWNEDKNKWLKDNRKISFELIAVKLMNGDLIDIIAHNTERYPHQYIVLVNIENYIYAVPFVLDEKNKVVFLKTIIPSRKFTKKYLRRI